MAFSSRLGGKAKPAPSTAPVKEVTSAVHEGESFDSYTRKQEALAEARRKAAEDEARREAYEQEKARQATIARSKAEAARRAASGSVGNDAKAPSMSFGGSTGGYAAGSSSINSGTQSFSWKKGSPQTPGQGLSFGGTLKRPTGSPAARDGASRPGRETCDEAISAMVSRTYNGMKEGLQLLGLPDYPLTFVPGSELKLCGHDVREEINEMIHNWMTDEKDDFYECLKKIREKVSKPILTEEEVDMLQSKDQWQRVTGPDGKVQFTRPTQQAAEDTDSDEEVIDVTPDGRRLPASNASRLVSGNPASASSAASSAARGVSSFGASTKANAVSAGGSEDYYSLLGVSSSASLQEIRTKFRALVMVAHPEKGGDAKTFAQLNKAYGVLSDQTKRREYDESRLAE